ncbi:hypothetical protein Droror1_Dr00027240 [Drosera rotundifolia]
MVDGSKEVGAAISILTTILGAVGMGSVTWADEIELVDFEGQQGDAVSTLATILLKDIMKEQVMACMSYAKVARLLLLGHVPAKCSYVPPQKQVWVVKRDRRKAVPEVHEVETPVSVAPISKAASVVGCPQVSRSPAPISPSPRAQAASHHTKHRCSSPATHHHHLPSPLSRATAIIKLSHRARCCFCSAFFFTPLPSLRRRSPQIKGTRPAISRKVIAQQAAASIVSRRPAVVCAGAWAWATRQSA